MTICRNCNKDFLPRSTGGKLQVYCCANCRLEYHNKLKTTDSTLRSNIPPNINGGRVAVCETCELEFTTRKRGGGRRQRYCSEKCGFVGYYKENPSVSWERDLKKNYGMTPDDYKIMFAEQGGVCRICKRPPKNNRLAVDHCHQTGFVRGLLCSPCNRHVGYFEKMGTQIMQYLDKEKYPFNGESLCL